MGDQQLKPNAGSPSIPSSEPERAKALGVGIPLQELSPERQLFIALERFVAARDIELDFTGQVAVELKGGHVLYVPIALIQDAP